jgi:hypothetical protein
VLLDSLDSACTDFSASWRRKGHNIHHAERLHAPSFRAKLVLSLWRIRNPSIQQPNRSQFVATEFNRELNMPGTGDYLVVREDGHFYSSVPTKSGESGLFLR